MTLVGFRLTTRPYKSGLTAKNSRLMYDTRANVNQVTREGPLKNISNPDEYWEYDNPRYTPSYIKKTNQYIAQTVTRDMKGVSSAASMTTNNSSFVALANLLKSWGLF
jgi:hypothetical protein